MEYLVFRLYGPMASWGEIAVGEMRHTASCPSKSAIFGLLAAALGIEREEDAQHQALAEGYMQAVKLVNTGRLLKDYHTTQAPDAVGKFRYRTRRDELIAGKERLGTVLSSREYHTDAQAIVALQPNDNAPFDLDVLQQALSAPKFHLYLGRKSCPLAAPLDPQKIQTSCFRKALDIYDLKPLLPPSEYEWQTDKRWMPLDTLTHYYWEGAKDAFSPEEDGFSMSEIQTLTRHDQPLSRKRWQFQPRTEHMWLSSNKRAE